MGCEADYRWGNSLSVRRGPLTIGGQPGGQIRHFLARWDPPMLEPVRQKWAQNRVQPRALSGSFGGRRARSARHALWWPPEGRTGPPKGADPRTCPDISRQKIEILSGTFARFGGPAVPGCTPIVRGPDKVLVRSIISTRGCTRATLETRTY